MVGGRLCLLSVLAKILVQHDGNEHCVVHLNAKASAQVRVNINSVACVFVDSNCDPSFKHLCQERARFNLHREVSVIGQKYFWL